jgi:enamine deaminase RidA (YjgF/YER057c/UK114 family)
MVYLSGMAAEDISQDIEGQTRQTLASIDRLLAKAGSEKSKLLRVEVWLSDMAHFETMNAVYREWLDPDNIPARVCTQARLWDDAALVEIMATATRRTGE